MTIASLITIVILNSFLNINGFQCNSHSIRNLELLFAQHPKSPSESEREKSIEIFKVLSAIGYFPTIARAANAISPSLITRDIDTERYKLPPANIQSDDFWFPPYMIGTWNTTLTFSGAKFTNLIPFEDLSQNENIPGFSPYSVFLLPILGQDINTTLKYVQIDAHPREDHSFNLRQIMKSCLPETVVDAAPYAYQKAPDWFHSPANKWYIKYHDPYGTGKVEILTRKRKIEAFAGTLRTIQFIKQTHQRTSVKGTTSTTIGDYAIDFRVSVPSSSQDEFTTTDALSRTKSLIGTLDILAYLQPTNDMYLKVPAQPAGVFSYRVDMTRTDAENVEYPFVWREDGPVELDTYFGY